MRHSSGTGYNNIPEYNGDTKKKVVDKNIVKKATKNKNKNNTKTKQNITNKQTKNKRKQQQTN